MMLGALKQALILDDDVDLCILLKAILGKKFPTVAFTHTIKTGRNFIKENKPDVVFLDNNLPDGQGVEMINEIKLLSPGTLIILISAVQNLRSKAAKWNADGSIEKPLTSTNIDEALQLSHFRG